LARLGFSDGFREQGEQPAELAYGHDVGAFKHAGKEEDQLGLGSDKVLAATIAVQRRSVYDNE
jgi:hypothetical protein